MRFNHPKGTGFYSLFATGMKYLRTASGAPPLTIAAALNERYRSMTLYGNSKVVTDDEKGVTTTYGVGERTENLFDIAYKIPVIHKPNLLADVTWKKGESAIWSDCIDIDINDKYTITNLHANGSWGVWVYDSENQEIARTYSIKRPDGSLAFELKQSSFDVVSGDLAEAKSIRIRCSGTNMSYINVVNMESDRTTYSYNLYTTGADSTSEDGVKHAAGGLFAVNKIPDTLTVNPVSQTAIIERHSKAENGGVVYAEMTTEDVSDIQDWDKIPKLDNGEIVINVGTEVKPDKITVEYFTKYKPLTTEDGIILTTEDGTIIGGIS